MKKAHHKKPQRRGPAILLLLACTSMAAYRLREYWLDGSLAGIASAGGLVEDPSAAEMPESQAPALEVGEQWVDLLAKHGSCDEGQVVPSVFRYHPATVAADPTPAGELSASLQADWRDGDPPQVRIGVVLISEACRRAVIDNQVLGIGDVVAGGKVHRIDRGTVQILWHRRTLTYELGEGYPVEFRSEMARRAAATPLNQEANGQETRDTEAK
jgi:hypothetical protein